MKPLSLLFLLFPLILPAWTPQANALTLSADQQARLLHGDVVLLDQLPSGGSDEGGQGGTAVTLVRASARSVWNILVDYTGHVGLFPRVTHTKVLESDAAHALVRYVIGVGPFSFSFYVDNFPDRARGRIDWNLDKNRDNDLFQDSWGYWQMEPYGNDDILLTYSMGARTYLPAFLTRGSEREGLVQTVKAVRARAQEQQLADARLFPQPKPAAD